MASDDPDVERKAADFSALYPHPPQHAAVSCVDGKTANQAWIGSIWFYRSRLAAPSGVVLSTTGMGRSRSAPPSTPKPGEALGNTAVWHTSAKFVAFLTDIVVN